MIEVAALATVLLLFRVAAFVAFLPPFFGRNVPQTVKVGLAVGLTLLWIPQQVAIAAPELAWTVGPEPRWGALGYLVIRETLFGIGLAWLLGLALVPVRIGGSYVAQEMGLTLGAITSSTDQQASTSSPKPSKPWPSWFCLRRICTTLRCDSSTPAWSGIRSGSFRKTHFPAANGSSAMCRGSFNRDW